MRFRAEEIESALSANVNFDGEFEISTDTRTIKKGDLYLPLKGANFDGEAFCDKAIEAGAAGCFYTKEKPCAQAVKVDDTLKAYLQLANYVRRKYNPKVIGVTGSSGKTTTKEMIYSVLSMPEDTEVLIIEMGMRGLGEIELITKYAEPDFAVITNAGSAHIGRLGSLDNIAKAKCEITSDLKETLIAHDCERLRKFADFTGEKIFYSIRDVKILEKSEHYSKFEYKGNIYELNVGGDYNIGNALSAINTGLKLGMKVSEIQAGLKKYKPIEKRWEAVNAGGFEIINDSYNANPESMRAFADTIFELYKNAVVILGDMGELGDDEIKYHRELGEYINSHKNLKPDTMILSVGTLSRYITDEVKTCPAKHFETIEDAVSFIKTLDKKSKIFLKASRSMKFEQIIERLK